MNSKLIFILTLILFSISLNSCEKQDFTPYPKNLQGNWLITSPQYLLDYGNGISLTITKTNTTISNEEVVLEQEGTYLKADPNGILVFGGGYLSTTGYGTWGYIEEQNKLYLDRIEYYNFNSEAGNTYKLTMMENELHLESTGITATNNNRVILLQSYRPFSNLGFYNGNYVIENLNPNDYDAGYKEGEYISYVIGYLRNLVNTQSQVILDNNPYSYYLNGYLDATQSIWAPSAIDNNYLQGVRDGIASGSGTSAGNTDFQNTTGKIATVFESYVLLK